MYLRWKKKFRIRRHLDEQNKITLCAVLVESQREDGKIKQTVIKYLGSIRHEHIQFSSRRHRFWRMVMQNLSPLQIPEKNMHTILSKLQDVVPKPADDDDISERSSLVRELLRSRTR
jgi:hypothetical protein